jgi:[CysO sulfur-carrier protein]-thiocarboxylate-dependent cysteine synthase
VVWTKKLQEEEGLFIGVSSGAIASIATRVAADLDEGNVVFVAPDDGWKYLSSGVYDKPLEQLEDVIDSASFW